MSFWTESHSGKKRTPEIKKPHILAIRGKERITMLNNENAEECARSPGKESEGNGQRKLESSRMFPFRKPFPRIQ